jgi:hypothetical protein
MAPASASDLDLEGANSDARRIHRFAYRVPVSRPARRSPAELSPAPWPAEASADPVAEVARRLVGNLEREIGDRSIRSVADAAGVDHSTLLGLLRGRSWPDLVTIARLEQGLGADLWPGRAAG